MLKKEIEYGIKTSKKLFWVGESRLLFEPIVELSHWTRDKWFAKVIDDNGQLINKTIRSSEIVDWTGGSAVGIELARSKLDAYDARKVANAKPLELQPKEPGSRFRRITDAFEPAW